MVLSMQFFKTLIWRKLYDVVADYSFAHFLHGDHQQFKILVLKSLFLEPKRPFFLLTLSDLGQYYYVA